MSSVPVPKLASIAETELRSLLREYRKQNWQGIQTPEWQERIVEDMVRDDGESVLRQVTSFWNLPPSARVLDIGSGAGSFVVACRQRGLLAFGIEPDRIGQGGNLTSIQIASRRLPYPAFASALGENLPFPDGSFDLVTMNQVIEHVSDQAAVLREAFRVLKPRGALYVACPNYLRCYEPHYKMFWLPLLPKQLGRWYLRLRGRNPVLLNQLTYTTNARIRELLSGCGDCGVLDLHREQFLRKRISGSFVSRRGQLVARATRLPVFGPVVTWLALLFLRVTEGGCEMLVLRPHSADTQC